MDYTIWNQILLELALSVSGEQELDKLVKKGRICIFEKTELYSCQCFTIQK